MRERERDSSKREREREKEEGVTRGLPLVGYQQRCQT